MEPIFSGRVENGKLVIENLDKFREYLTTLQDRVQIIVRKPKKKQRSNEQNRYLWGVCYKLLSEWSGDTTEEWHEICKQMFVEPTKKIIDGNTYEIRKSSTALNTKEFTDYIEKIRRFGAEHGVIIPDPDQTYYD